MNRYEFRIWDRDLASVRRAIDRLASPSEPVASDEIYLISSATDYCNAKIRDALLDIKVLLKVERRLEQWSPVLKAGFPLQASAIVQLFDSLKLPPPQAAQPTYEMEEFLDQALKGGIAIVRTSKLRTHFKFDQCQTEFAKVHIDEIAQETVAVESDDPDAVLTAAARIGIADRENVSYVRNIERVRARR